MIEVGEFAMEALLASIGVKTEREAQTPPMKHSETGINDKSRIAAGVTAGIASMYLGTAMLRKAGGAKGIPTVVDGIPTASHCVEDLTHRERTGFSVSHGNLQIHESKNKGWCATHPDIRFDHTSVPDGWIPTAREVHNYGTTILGMPGTITEDGEVRIRNNIDLACRDLIITSITITRPKAAALHGWVLCVRSTVGAQSYYYNQQTDEVAWFLPDILSSVDEQIKDKYKQATERLLQKEKAINEIQDEWGSSSNVPQIARYTQPSLDADKFSSMTTSSGSHTKKDHSDFMSVLESYEAQVSSPTSSIVAASSPSEVSSRVVQQPVRQTAISRMAAPPQPPPPPPSKPPVIGKRVVSAPLPPVAAPPPVVAPLPPVVSEASNYSTPPAPGAPPPPPAGSTSAPPPPPRAGGVPPPPPKPAVGSIPPPPPRVGGVPPPPPVGGVPPPPPSGKSAPASGGSARSDLMDAILKGTKLKSVSASTVATKPAPLDPHAALMESIRKGAKVSIFRCCFIYPNLAPLEVTYLNDLQVY